MNKLGDLGYFGNTWVRQNLLENRNNNGKFDRGKIQTNYFSVYPRQRAYHENQTR